MEDDVCPIWPLAIRECSDTEVSDTPQNINKEPKELKAPFLK